MALPAFAKIDVEGFELAVLKGLSRAIPALSFEFTTIQRDVAEACLDRLSGAWRLPLQCCAGRKPEPRIRGTRQAARMAEFVAGLPHSANSGDIYARLPA